MSARNDAIDAAAKATTALRAASLAATGWPASQREVALTAVDAAIPVLLAPIRALHHCVPMRAVEGYCPDCNVIWPCATVRLLDQIEGGESR